MSALPYWTIEEMDYPDKHWVILRLGGEKWAEQIVIDRVRATLLMEAHNDEIQALTYQHSDEIEK